MSIESLLATPTGQKALASIRASRFSTRLVDGWRAQLLHDCGLALLYVAPSKHGTFAVVPVWASLLTYVGPEAVVRPALARAAVDPEYRQALAAAWTIPDLLASLVREASG